MFSNKFIEKGLVSHEQIHDIVNRFDTFNVDRNMRINTFTEISKDHLQHCAKALVETNEGEDWAAAIHYTLAVLKRLVEVRSESLDV